MEKGSDRATVRWTEGFAGLAATNKPIAQLAIYTLVLTRLVPGFRLFDIKCARFNEEEYCEFFPRLLFSRPRNS